MIIPEKDRRRFLSRAVVQPDGCVLWDAAKSKSEYGRFWLVDRLQLAHRVAYAMFVGPLVDGLQIDHLCRVPACVAPAHLEQVTSGENTRRGNCADVHRALHASVTHCPKGHPYDAVNTYRPPGDPKHRQCRECRRLLKIERRKAGLST